MGIEMCEAGTPPFEAVLLDYKPPGVPVGSIASEQDKESTRDKKWTLFRGPPPPPPPPFPLSLHSPFLPWIIDDPRWVSRSRNGENSHPQRFRMPNDSSAWSFSLFLVN